MVGTARTVQAKALLVLVAPAASVIATCTLFDDCALFAMVPVILPLASMARFVGALSKVSVHGAFGQLIDATCRFTTAPTVFFCAPGPTTLGAATTVQVKVRDTVDGEIPAVGSDTVTVVENLPNAVGLPLIKPVVGPIVSPGGSPV